MDESIKKHCKQFHSAILLEENQELSWKEAHDKASFLPKGWWELSKLEPSIKLEFIRDYWLNALPYTPHVYAFIDRFFAGVKSLNVMLIKEHEKSLFFPYLAYHLDDRFFLGGYPMKEKEIERFKHAASFPIPEDFLNFLRIHNGLSRGEDTGILPTEVMLKEKSVFRQEAEKREIHLGKEKVDPQSLFPFYRSFNLDSYQCFFKDWYPDGATGNVFCSFSEGKVSSLEEKLGFRTFLDWLVFYMDHIIE